MKIAWRVGALIIAAAAGIWLWTVVFPSPEAVIRRQLAELANSMSFTGKEGVVVRAARVLKLNDFFANEIQITYEFPKGNLNTISGLEEIGEQARLAAMAGGPLRVELLDPNVKLSADKQSATTEVTLRARVPDEKEFFVQEMKFTLKLTKDGWRIIRIETVRTLSQIPAAGRKPGDIALTRRSEMNWAYRDNRAKSDSTKANFAWLSNLTFRNKGGRG